MKTGFAPFDGTAVDTAPIERLRQYQRDLRRFVNQQSRLPLSVKAHCLRCDDVVDARFEKLGSQVVLTYDCPRCGMYRQVHHDAIWSKAASSRTRSGSPIAPVQPLLPRTVRTLCPQCGAIIVGRYYVADGAVMIEKTCPEHGYFRDRVNSDVRLYAKTAAWTFGEPDGLDNPHVPVSGQCPSSCGLCGQHQSGSCLANIDLTNRCNLRCPICFANSAAVGYIYEPDLEQIRRMLQMLRDYRPVPCTSVQFSGGEPTLHPRFFQVLRMAAEMGFSNIQVATNGLKFADLDFARRAAEAGLHTLYLQFDGLSDDVYVRTRGRPLWQQKLACIENCRQVGLKICLVPTIVRGLNDDQVGGIFRFAVANVDVINAISYQPVCFTGRIDQSQRLQQRYTLGDLAHDIADASGADVYRDFYPLSFVVPISEFLQAITGQPKIRSSCHPDCAVGTYFLVSSDRKCYPFPKVFDIEALFCQLHEFAASIKRPGRLSLMDKLRIVRIFKRNFRRQHAPPDLTVDRFLDTLMGMVDKSKGRGEGEKRTYRTLMAAGMHFMDRYNYDVERVRRCVIHYATPAGVFPFCTYNGGPTYRPLVERAFSGGSVVRADSTSGRAEGADGPVDGVR